MPILSPSSRDSRSGRRGPTEIGRHEQAIELRSGDPGYVPLNRLDVATAIVTDRNLLTSWQGDEEDGFDTPSRVADLVSGMRVKKFGRTTGFSTGVVYSYEGTPWPLGYKHSDFTATARFTDTWTILADGADPFALPGDSGSLVVTEDGTAAVGLLFAANTRGDHGTIIPIGDVLEGLGNLQLVSRHGI